MTLYFPHTIARRADVFLLTTPDLGQYTSVLESSIPAHDIGMIKMSAARDTDKDQQ